MEELNDRDDRNVIFVDVGEGDSPVTREYGVTGVPHFFIYDGEGVLESEGEEAFFEMMPYLGIEPE